MVDGGVVTMVITEVKVVTMATEMADMVTMETRGILGITETEMVVIETQMAGIEEDQIDISLIKFMGSLIRISS